MRKQFTIQFFQIGKENEDALYVVKMDPYDYDMFLLLINSATEKPMRMNTRAPRHWTEDMENAIFKNSFLI